LNAQKRPISADSAVSASIVAIRSDNRKQGFVLTVESPLYSERALCVHSFTEDHPAMLRLVLLE